MMLSIFGNVQDKATWRPDPNERGTSGLLQQHHHCRSLYVQRVTFEHTGTEMDCLWQSLQKNYLALGRASVTRVYRVHGLGAEKRSAGYNERSQQSDGEI